ncbi:MAG: Pycsar system effector family protein [Saprospiraceae bacterium]
MTETIQRAEVYVKDLLTNKLPPNHYYHDWSHTKTVYKEAKALGLAAKLSPDEMEILLLSSLFHDTGFTVSYIDHETHSMEITKAYLASIGYPEDKSALVFSTIDATRMPHAFTDRLGSLLQDADLSSLAASDWEERADLLRKEQAAIENRTYTDEEWIRQNLDFYKETRYLTEEGKARYNDNKDVNQDALKKINKKLKKGDQKSLIDSSRTAELLFKTALRNHISLTQIADNKANIMLSINALILTFALPILLQKSKFLDNWYFVVPVTVIGGCCIISIIYAALATQPGKFKGKFVTDDLESGKGSLFFFGNFYASSLESYTRAMKKALVDVNRMDESAILDLYFLGKGLGRKFILLRRCYSFFLSGIIIGSAIFVIGFLIAKA